MSEIPPQAWSEWLRSFREGLIAKQGWSEKEAKRCLRDAWAIVRDGPGSCPGRGQPAAS